MASGFGMVDFIDLPGFERCIVRLLLRETELSYRQLCQAVAEMPGDLRMDPMQLDTALDHLTRSQWLVCEGDAQDARYRISPLQPSSHDHSFGDDRPLEGSDQQHSAQIELNPMTGCCRLRAVASVRFRFISGTA
jgi:hypothetical protein